MTTTDVLVVAVATVTGSAAVGYLVWRVRQTRRK